MRAGTEKWVLETFCGKNQEDGRALTITNIGLGPIILMRRSCVDMKHLQLIIDFARKPKHPGFWAVEVYLFVASDCAVL